MTRNHHFRNAKKLGINLVPQSLAGWFMGSNIAFVLFPVAVPPAIAR